MNDLTLLWESRVGAILGIVRAGETEHREVASLAAQVGVDYYGRFLVELLQNASDQAAEAGLCDSCVTIIRTTETVSLANAGMPFTPEGLRSITSLGLSTKNPQDAIGNKGIGFKSVFQISESPEIYSSPLATDSVVDAQGLMFKLSLSPFASPKFEDVLRTMVTDQLATLNPVDASLTIDQAMSEIKAAAPFKFPLPLSAAELEARLAEFGERPSGQTLVVLPIRRTPEVIRTVELAIDELLEDQGAAILFLPSVSTIRVVDQTRQLTRTISRRIVGSPRRIEGFGKVLTVITCVEENGAVNERSWRLIERRIGTTDVVPAEQASKETDLINGEAAKLPGPNWDAVKSSPIGVAVPLATQFGGGSLLLGANGRLCIGLPTKDLTGTPAWINAHFYGTISRKGIDLSQNSYNAILFTEIVRLHEALIGDLKADSDIRIRRVATLAFERNEGPLADALYDSSGQSQAEVILSIDGETFQSPADTILPKQEDVDALLLMVPNTADLKRFGLTLPEIELTQCARALIESLFTNAHDSNTIEALLLGRTRKSVSVIEHASVVHRSDGQAFWEKFLSWIVRRFAVERVSDQRILPIGKDGLATPAERVFLPPSPRSTDSSQDDDNEISELPADLSQSLKFLDSAAVVVRKAHSRSLTDLASQLAPDTGRGLVRSPRLDHLINEAVGPLMQALKEDEESRQTGIRLLRQAIQWLWALSHVGYERLTKDVLRVPVLGVDDRWLWVSPSATYFGSGWLSNEMGLLLQECYGHEPNRMLLSWDQFSSAFGLAGNDREAWIGALERLGVSSSPKLIESRSPRSAPLVSLSYSELTIHSETCPIKKAAPFWRPYLEYTRTRKANTASGQKFDFRSITWIDGLEREPSRSAVVKLLLLNPSVYGSGTSTILERQHRQNDDAKAVPSLWAHAISVNDWQVVPTQRGSVPAGDAWLVDRNQRGLARRRLALLNQVESAFDSGAQLLHGIGVPTLQTASVDRLLHAIGRLGSSCDSLDAESRRIALALAQDLFSYLQTAYAKSPTTLPDLKSVRLPLERNGDAVGIQGDQISVGYFNDDPVRAGFIPNFGDALVWPLDARHAQRDLVTELRRQLGASAVIYTSVAPVQSRFTEDATLKRVSLLDWLSSEFPHHSVASDLAALIAYTGREIDPNGEEFRRTWRLFEKASLVFGVFPGDAPTPYFYDRTEGLLQVTSAISGEEKVEATWMLVGPGHRDTWSAYARELGRGSPAKFLIDRRITLAHRENVENAIGLSSAERFKPFRSSALALWIIRNGSQPIPRFEEEWNVNARSVRGLCDWLGRSDLADTFAKLLGGSEEAAALAFIRPGFITSEQWQQARQSLGMEPGPFTHKVAAWSDAMNELVSILKTCVARAVSVAPPAIEPILRSIQESPPPDEVAFNAGNEEEILQVALRRADSIVDESGNVTGIELLRRRLKVLVEEAKATLAAVDWDDAPARDVRVYRYEDEGKRSRDSQARFDGLMTVASALANQMGETIAADNVRADSRVSLLLTGWWANRFTVMVAIQRVFQARIPKTAQRMSDERVFRDPAPANELLARFKELTEADHERPAPPIRRISILGDNQAEGDIVADLLRGTSGFIGRALKKKADAQLLEPSMGRRARGQIRLQVGRTKAQGRGSGAGRSAGQDRKDRELLGLLGEAFVYELFRSALPGFDEMAWCSCNREAYGLEGKGDDSLGFDFSYQDTENRLTGRSDRPLCFIEVKSTSGVGNSPFPITTNEWEKARECHYSADSVHIIVRVAHVRDDPKVSDLIIDPFGLYRNGEVDVITQDMWVYVGQPQAN